MTGARTHRSCTDHVGLSGDDLWCLQTLSLARAASTQDCPRHSLLLLASLLCTHFSIYSAHCRALHCLSDVVQRRFQCRCWQELLHSESCFTCAGLAAVSTKHSCHSVLNGFKVRVLKMWFDWYGREQSVWRLFIANRRPHR